MSMTPLTRREGGMMAKSSNESSRDLAIQLGMEVVADLVVSNLPREVIKKIPYAFVKQHVILPIKEEAGSVTVAVSDPLNLQGVEELRMMLGKSIKTVYSPAPELLLAIDACFHREEGAASQLIADMREGARHLEGTGSEDSYDLLDDTEQAPVVKLLNLIIGEAIQQGASDIHFEPFESDMRVRYRIDGVLQNRHSPPREHQAQLLTRIKVLAKLDIAEHRLPQDGRSKLNMGGKEIDFRVSTVPVTNGERIVLRILDKGNVTLGLNQIGMPPELLKKFQRLVHMPEGIILVTGPTGSGKTTTLYSAICDLNAAEVNIMTIEEPVEYKLSGIAQIGVRPKIKLTFAAGLRHILRQDPDVIMIGEIRDAETAEIAIQASLTGHLVLSTLHTNDAPSAVARLVDMKVEPYLLASSVIGVLAQRLVRRICPSCIVSYEPLDKELEELNLSRASLLSGMLQRGSGCLLCYGSGYKGRHAIYELMVINNALKRQISKSADAVELRKIAVETGMTTLHDHGAELVKQGITTVSEVLRVCMRLESYHGSV